MSSKQKILVVQDHEHPASFVLPEWGEDYEVEVVASPLRALARLAKVPFAGVYVLSSHLSEAVRIGKLLQNERILEGMPDGVVLLDSDNTILWGNGRLSEWSGRETVVGMNFYAALGSPEILGPDFCPFNTALNTGRPSGSKLRSADNKYWHVHAAPVVEGDGPPQHLIVTVRDVTNESLQQKKLEAIHKAGQELNDLKPNELSVMSVDERIEYLKSNILQLTKNLLQYDVVEVRLLDHKTGLLEPLLAVGMQQVAAERVLRAEPQGNGVTGYVAATGQSYLCEDTTEDPLFLEGCAGAKSSLTVPLMLHDEVIGTFNVESPERHSFTESDRQFVEIFARDVAMAINMLDLLVAEQANAATGAVEAIHSAVALPVDVILNEAVNVMERYIGHEPEVVERLLRILRNARDIKQVIQKVGQKMAPAQALPANRLIEKRPALRNARILVVDADPAVRSAAHALMERYGCIVETAQNGGEATSMVRGLIAEDGYDAILADIRLPDMNGYELMVKLQDVLGQVPMILMAGYGYDPAHSIVKCRQAGLQKDAVLCKPFRLDQLLTVVESVITAPKPEPTS